MLYKISGTLMLNNSTIESNKSIPLNCSIDVFDTSPNVNGELQTSTWLGYTEINTKGEFVLFLTQEIEENKKLVFSIYKGNNLITHQYIDAKSVVDLEISVEVYDSALKDNSRIRNDLNYVSLNGSVFLGPKAIRAIPINENFIKVRLIKNEFRNEVVLAQSYLNKFGEYQLKIPLRLLYPLNDNIFIKNLPEVCIQLLTEEGIELITSGNFSLNESGIEYNFNINEIDGGFYQCFLPELIGLSNLLSEVTKLPSNRFSEINNLRENGELDILAVTSGLSFIELQTLVLASKFSEYIDIPYAYMYAIFKAKGASEDVLFNLTLEEFSEIIQSEEENFIIPLLEENIEDSFNAIQNFKTQRVTQLKSTENDDINALLKLILNNENDVKVFLKLYVNINDSSLSSEQFWENAKLALGNFKIAKLQKGFQIFALTGLQYEMTESLINTLDNADTREILPYWSIEEWYDYISSVSLENEKLCVPKSIIDKIDENNEESFIIKNYAKKLYILTGSLFANEVLKKHLEIDSDFSNKFENSEQIILFLENNPEFDFRLENVWHNESLKNNKTLLSDLQIIQNIVKLTNGIPDLVVALIKKSYFSSSKIVAITQEEFINKFNDIILLDTSPIKFDEETLTSIYHKALSNDFIIKNIYTEMLPGTYVEQVTKDWDPSVWKENNKNDTSTPNISDLFGNTDFCTCNHCSSMYSPSAYFTDLLNFIKTKINNTDVYFELLRRRPDLPYIDLSCKNANTNVPYIDLVNELLELIVLNDPNDPRNPPNSFQTDGDERELVAYPEHKYKVNIGLPYANYTDYIYVYNEKLNQAIYPNTLPFNLALEETRICFKLFKTNRIKLMELFKPTTFKDVNSTSIINLYHVSTESLGISKFEADIIAKEDLPNPVNLEDFYGNPQGIWYENLCENLNELLARNQISYITLLELLTTDFLNKPIDVNQGRPFVIVAKSGFAPDTCVVEELKIHCVLQPEEVHKIAFFDKLHRFIRLQRATNWTVSQLDIILNSFEYEDIDKSTITLIGQVKYISDYFNMSPEYLTGNWGNLNTLSYIDFQDENQKLKPSIFQEIFQNKTISNPTDVNFNDPENIIGTYFENMGTIIAGTELSEVEVKQILDFLEVNINNQTELSIISKIYGLSIILQKTKYSIYDLLRIYRLLEIDILSNQSPATKFTSFLKYIVFIDKFKESVFNLDELDYLLANKANEENPLPKEKTIQNFYENLREELKNESNKIEWPIGSRPASLEDIVIQEMSDTFQLSQEMISYFFKDLLKISDELILDLLVNPIFISSDNYIIPSESIPGLNFADLYVLYYRMQKMSLILTKLSINTFELKSIHFLLDQLDLEGLNDLPVGTQTNEDTLYLLQSLFRLSSWIKVRDSLRLTKEEFCELLFQSTGETEDAIILDKVNWKTYVSNLLGWDLNTLQFLVGDNNEDGILETSYTLNPDTNAFKEGELLLQINNLILVLQHVGLSAEKIFSTLQPQVLMEDSLNIRKAAKSKYEEKLWLEKSENLQNQLRKKQRNALVDYVIANPTLLQGNQMHIKNKNDLYAYLLIDAEMEPCMLTSRIRQGISSLQLFMDRILLNIEQFNGGNILTIANSYGKQWKSWRKWYRVWEANRKVFFYPENWIEPELRDDKSKLFKELEMQLMQQELTDEVAEDAFIAYLDGLEEVANLEPVSIYKQENPTIYHAFARNNAEPQAYYYRTKKNNTWSAWEKVETDIKGNHVTPVMWNGRLYLFWLTFIKKQTNTEELQQLIIQNQPSSFNNKKWINKITDPNAELVNDEINNFRFSKWEIRLHWSQFQDGRWSASSMSKDVMEFDFSRIILNNNSIQSYSDWNNSKQKWNFLSKKNEIPLDEFFTNRIYLLASYESHNEADGINFNILFPGGWDENGIGTHAFLWKGDNSKDPYVLRDSDRGHQLIAPLNTRFNKMKFVKDNLSPNALYKDGYVSEVDGYYAYSINTYFDNFPRIIRQGSTKVLSTTPFGGFKITSQAKSTSSHAVNPLQDLFFFEDDKNIFFVEKIQNQTYAYTQAIQNLNQISLSAMTQFVNINYLNQLNLNVSSPQSNTINNSVLNHVFSPDKYRFHTFYHPQINQFKSLVYTQGVAGLLQLNSQSQQDTMHFSKNYKPTSLVHSLYPNNQVQFAYTDPYSIYNWEIFFHTPMLIAGQLSNNLRFEEAQKWYHYIFDPTKNTDIHGNIITNNQRFWRFYPFYEEAGQSAQTLSELMLAIYQNVPEAVEQVQHWENNPFQPFIIARMRKLAFMKNVLMKYLDNLIAWADHLYKLDTIESINEATQLYILAANILGEKPKEIPPRVKKDIRNFIELIENGPLDMLSNAMVAIESYFSPNAGPDFYIPTGDAKPGEEDGDRIMLQTLYFCLPKNEKLLNYWDIIADRLFKIRHCMDLSGLERVLALYEPPIDPALLVRATTLGVDIPTVLTSVHAQTPNYRFHYILQKANEFSADVRNLGSSLLQSLEKKDAEALSLLRSGQELQLLSHIRTVKEMQVHDAENALEVLEKNKDLVQARLAFYSSRTFVNSEEAKHLEAITQTTNLQVTQAGIQAVSSVLAMIPQIHAQVPMAVGPSIGGQHFSAAMNAVSSGMGAGIAKQNHKAQMASLIGSYIRRKEDWEFQIELSNKELAQIDTQILGTKIKLEIAKKELTNHELQMKQSQEIDAFMREKYTNEQLYQWMISQLTATYFQSYYLARSFAEKAEECFKFELPLAKLPTQGFIGYHYWDNLKKGLLSGEQLQFDLRKMEAAYMDENERELELIKHVSLASFNPQALIDLQERGWTSFDIPEMLYDLDYPGHYLRRIKSVTLTFPNVSGPYTNISATLRIINNFIRKETVLINNQYKRQNEDYRFIQSQISNAMIATSTGMNDSGLFELNFKDERYLPFEGAGAISSWELSLPNTDGDDPAIQSFRQFDYQNITDVIMTIQYTARVGGEMLQKAAQRNTEEHINSLLDELGGSQTGLWQSLSLKRKFPTALSTLLNQSNNGLHSIELETEPKHFPYIFMDKEITTKDAVLILLPKEGKVSEMHPQVIQLQYMQSDWEEFGTGPAMDKNVNWGDAATIALTRSGTVSPLGKWKLEIEENTLGDLSINGIKLYDPVNQVFHAELIDDIILAINYKKA